MLADDKLETDTLNNSLDDQNGHLLNGPANVSSFQHSSVSYAVRLKIGTRKREVELSLNKAIHMGRVDPMGTVFPEVDLTGDGTLARSVSRRHARIIKQGNIIVIEDLGSVNGTFVNGERLSPYLPEPLNDGDTLQLGQLVIGVKIQKQ